MEPNDRTKLRTPPDAERFIQRLPSVLLCVPFSTCVACDKSVSRASGCNGPDILLEGAAMLS